MYEFIQGRLEEKTPTYTVLLANGVGYKLHTPANLLQKLPEVHSTILLYTSFVIRENVQALYGFLTKQERDLFEKLTNISGIGPKTALSLIGHLDVIDLVSCVQSNNVSALCKIPGIGKKTAERIVLETKDKFTKIYAIHEDIPKTGLQQIQQDAINALTHLGYSLTTAEKTIHTCLKDADTPLDLASLITKALSKCL